MNVIKKFLFFGFILITLLSIQQCKGPSKHLKSKKNLDNTLMQAPDWTKSAVIYEVNIRQYTEEGTLNAFSQHLPRLREMGVDILWLMPIFSIGVQRRKGSLGSPYSIMDYKEVNPDFGTMENFRNLVNKAHALGMKVVLDWVANHTSFDHVWTVEHPEWYTKDDHGNTIYPDGTDWTDVADLNYDNKSMRKAMIAAMKYWIQEYDIDGYRCDVAGFVPDDFWKEAIKSIQSVKHVFMLAEWEDPKMHKDGFHMTYGWNLHHVMNRVAKGEKGWQMLDETQSKELIEYPADAYRMYFTTNHDENSWNGTTKERLGGMADAMAVYSFTARGMPLIYSGQEAGLNKRLRFFDKDTIDWSHLSKATFYSSLIKLKHHNTALWNGRYGGSYKRIKTDNETSIYAFKRENEHDQVIVALNLTPDTLSFNWIAPPSVEKYINIFTKEIVSLNDMKNITLAPGGYLVLSKLNNSH